MKKIILLLLISGLVAAKTVLPKFTTTFKSENVIIETGAHTLESVCSVSLPIGDAAVFTEKKDIEIEISKVDDNTYNFKTEENVKIPHPAPWTLQRPKCFSKVLIKFREKHTNLKGSGKLSISKNDLKRNKDRILFASVDVQDLYPSIYEVQFVDERYIDNFNKRLSSVRQVDLESMLIVKFGEKKSIGPNYAIDFRNEKFAKLDRGESVDFKYWKIPDCCQHLELMSEFSFSKNRNQITIEKEGFVKYQSREVSFSVQKTYDSFLDINLSVNIGQILRGDTLNIFSLANYESVFEGEFNAQSSDFISRLIYLNAKKIYEDDYDVNYRYSEASEVDRLDISRDEWERTSSGPNRLLNLRVLR